MRARILATERRIIERLPTRKSGRPAASHRICVNRHRKHAARPNSPPAVGPLAARRRWCGRSFFRSVRWGNRGLRAVRLTHQEVWVFAAVGSGLQLDGGQYSLSRLRALGGGPIVNFRDGPVTRTHHPTINLLISELNIGRRAAALNLLNLAWGVGAVSGPALVPTLSRSVGLTFALLCVAAPLIGIGILIGRSTVLLPVAVKAGEATSSGAMRLWMTPYALLTAALVFVNIGTESATGGWIASYVQRLGPSSQLSWTVAPSLFWAGLLAGRAAAPSILRRVSETRMVLLGMFVAVSVWSLYCWLRQ